MGSAIPPALSCTPSQSDSPSSLAQGRKKAGRSEKKKNEKEITLQWTDDEACLLLDVTNEYQISEEGRSLVEAKLAVEIHGCVADGEVSR